MIVVENDAKNCYDRMVLEVATLATMRLGLPHCAAVFMILILLVLSCFLGLGGNFSNGHIPSSLSTFFDGKGQCTGWSQRILPTVLDIILLDIQKFQPGVHFASAEKNIIDYSLGEG